MAPPAFGNLGNAGGLKALNDFIIHFSYIGGWVPSQDDVTVFAQLSGCPDEKLFPHAARWYNHIASFAESARSSWPGEKVEVEAAKEEEEESDGGDPFADSDDEDDPFASDSDEDEEDEDAAAERKAAAEARRKAAEAKKGKKKRVDKSQVVLDVKPWEADTDLEALATAIKAIDISGVTWGEGHKKVPIGYGISKLQVSFVVLDEEASVDADVVPAIEALEDYVQSVDIVSFNKL